MEERPIEEKQKTSKRRKQRRKQRRPLSRRQSRRRKVSIPQHPCCICSSSGLYTFIGQAANANEDKGLEPQAVKDEDPDALKLMASPDILDQAAKLLQPLTTLAASNIQTWLSTYDVAIRRGRQNALSLLDKQLTPV